MELRQLYQWCLFNSGIQLHILALCPLPKDDGWKQGLWGKEEGGGGLRAVVIAGGVGTVSALTLTGVCEIHATLPMSQTQTLKDRVHGDRLVWGVTQLRSGKVGTQSQTSPTQDTPIFVIFSAAFLGKVEDSECFPWSCLALFCFRVRTIVRPGVRSSWEHQ